MFKSRFCFISLLSIMFPTMLFSCNKRVTLSSSINEKYARIEYKTIKPNLTVQEFNNCFTLGDLIEVNITNKNGENYKKVMPYVTNFIEAGVYTPCICGESNVEQEEAQPKNYIDVYFGLDDFSSNINNIANQTITFSLYEKGGYKEIISLVNCTKKLTYDELDRDSKAYSNFRDVTTIGRLHNAIESNVLFRGCSLFEKNILSPDNKRYIYADQLLKYTSTHYLISLYTDENEMLSKINALGDECKYTKMLIDNGDYGAVHLQNNFYSLEPGNGLYLVGKALIAIAKSYSASTTVYLSSLDGTNRTGFIIALLEALTLQNVDNPNDYVEEIVNDFMLSYKNQYGVSLADNIERFQLIANLTIYRHLYGMCVNNPHETLPLIDWLNFDSRLELVHILNKDSSRTLYDYAEDYALNAMKHYLINNKDNPMDEQKARSESLRHLKDIKLLICVRD